MPEINVQNGSFQDFLREWNKTDDLSPTHQVYHRRNLCKFFKPIQESTVCYHTYLFRYASYNLYDF